MKIGILTFHWADNYGAVLQAYALSRWIKNNIRTDDSVEIINYIQEDSAKMYRPFVFRNHSIKELIKGIIRGIKNYSIWKRKHKGFSEFRKKMPISKKYNRNKLINSEEDYDIWITGSDQVWNTEIVGSDYEIYDLAFIKKSKKCSYAASAGVIESEEKDQDKRLAEDINNLDCISVREISVQKSLQSRSVKRVERVLDPTFLIEKSKWNDLICENRIYPKKYIFVYVISYDSKFTKTVIDAANKKNLDIVVCGYIKELKGKAIQYNSLTPEDFLNLIKNAEYIIASSFHATAFSIIFEKQFFAFIPPYASNRVYDLCTVFGLENRIIKDYNDLELIIDNQIDYSKVNKTLSEEKKLSVKYLKEILNN